MHIDNFDITMPLVKTGGEKIVIRRDWRWRDTLWEMKYLAKEKYNRLCKRWESFLRKHWIVNILVQMTGVVVTGLMGLAFLLGIYIIFFWTPPV